MQGFGREQAPPAIVTARVLLSQRLNAAGRQVKVEEDVTEALYLCTRGWLTYMAGSSMPCFVSGCIEVSFCYGSSRYCPSTRELLEAGHGHIRLQ